MRDPNRLDKFYDEIRLFHKLCLPDLRFLQLFNNFYHWIFTEKKKDPFFIEEDETLELFREYALSHGFSETQ